MDHCNYITLEIFFVYLKMIDLEPNLQSLLSVFAIPFDQFVKRYQSTRTFIHYFPFLFSKNLVLKKMLGLVLAGLVSVVLSVIYYWAHQRQNYWRDRNIPYVKAPKLLGHFFKTVLLRQHNVDAMADLYHHPNAKGKSFVGINVFHKPAVLIRDPELIKRILIKDFNYFANRHVGADPVHDPMAGLALFQIKNPQWRDLRGKLSPIFTSGKMKQMFYMVENVGNVMNEVVGDLVKQGKPIIEIRTLLARYTIGEFFAKFPFYFQLKYHFTLSLSLN